MLSLSQAHTIKAEEKKKRKEKSNVDNFSLSTISTQVAL